MTVETSFILPSRSTPEQSPRSRSRRRGVDLSDNRSPSELLKEIGIAGAEVVKVLKGQGWEICEPKGLEEHKRYYLPGGRVKGEDAKRREDFVMGEGELYAYVLEKGKFANDFDDEAGQNEWRLTVQIAGGISYLFPNAGQFLVSNTAPRPRDKSVPRTETSETRSETTPKGSTLFESGEDTDLVEYFSDESSISISRQHQKKRRKKQKTPERAHSPDQQTPQETENVIVVDDNNDTDSTASRDRPTSDVPLSPEKCFRPSRRSEVEQYELALKTRGHRAQLLKDVDLNLLRSVAEIAFRQADLEFSDRGNIHELERFSQRIQVAKCCLSYSVADIVASRDNLSHSDAIGSGIDIPSFVSTGIGHLALMQDIERYILLVGQTLRQFKYSDHGKASQSTRPSSKATNLRPLQRHIDKTTGELLVLSMRICGKSKRNFSGGRG